jgi:hypothetical protein
MISIVFIAFTRSNEYIIDQKRAFGDLETFVIVVVVTYIFM